MLFFKVLKNFNNSFFKTSKKLVSKKIKLNSANNFTIRVKNDKKTFVTNEINQSFKISLRKLKQIPLKFELKMVSYFIPLQSKSD